MLSANNNILQITLAALTHLYSSFLWLVKLSTLFCWMVTGCCCFYTCSFIYRDQEFHWNKNSSAELEERRVSTLTFWQIFKIPYIWHTLIFDKRRKILSLLEEKNQDMLHFQRKILISVQDSLFDQCSCISRLKQKVSVDEHTIWFDVFTCEKLLFGP